MALEQPIQLVIFLDPVRYVWSCVALRNTRIFTVFGLYPLIKAQQKLGFIIWGCVRYQMNATIEQLLLEFIDEKK